MNRASQKRNQTAWLRRNGVTACPPWSLPRFFSYPALSHYYVWISQRKAAWPSHDNAERGSTGIGECNAACNAGDAALRRGISRNATGSAMRERRRQVAFPLGEPFMQRVRDFISWLARTSSSDTADIAHRKNPKSQLSAVSAYRRGCMRYLRLCSRISWQPKCRDTLIPDFWPGFLSLGDIDESYLISGRKSIK